MTDTTDLIARLREYGLVAGKPYTAQDCACHDAADALEAQARTIDELRNALACELDDTRNACGLLNEEIARLQSRLAASEEQMKVDRLIVEEARRNEVAAERERGEAVALLHQTEDAKMALRKERDEAVEYGTRTRREWQRECEDTNLMLQGLGLCPSEYRSEGGSLLLGRISHKLKQRGGLS